MACYVLPESVLQRQVCSTCKKYLSYPPTKIYLTGEIKCGRCSSPDDGGTVSAAFETLARKLLFPCSNRFDGCSKMLHYEATTRHESTCTGTSLVECPICPSWEGSIRGPRKLTSILHLIHHFKLIHPRNVLAEPLIECDMQQEFTDRHLLYCNPAVNKVFLLRVSWEQQLFSLSCSTSMKCLTSSSLSTRLSLMFFGPEEDVRREFSTTDSKWCSDIENSFTSPAMFEFPVPVHLTKVKCKLLFDQPTPLMAIMEFRQPKWDYDHPKRVSRKLYLDKDFKKRYDIEDAASFKLSPCGLKLVHENYSLPVACDFCENFLAHSEGVWHHASHQCYVCSTCYLNGVRKSLDNKDVALEKLEDGDYYLLNFYCLHGCGKFFRSGELLSHEDQCEFNDRRLLSVEEYVKSAFRNDDYLLDIGEDTTCYSKDNLISITPNRKGKILMATRDNFKCVIDYEVDSSDSSRCNFHVNHHYDTGAYYVSIHKWEDQKYSEEYNDFSMKVKDCEEQEPCLFAIILKEIREDLDIFFDV